MSSPSFISPFFIVTDLQSSVAFYVNKLGFEVWHMGPDENPFFAMVGRGPVSIMLKQISQEVQPVPNHTRHPWASWDAYISVSEPDILFEEFRSRDIPFHKPILNNSDGLRGFEVKDVNGYILFFGCPA